MSTENQRGKLLTPRIVKYIYRGFRYGEVLRIHPFHWNSETEKVEISKNDVRLLAWKFNVLLSYAYFGFMMVRHGQIVLSETESKLSKVYMNAVMVFYSFLPMHHATILMRTSDLAAFVTKYYNFLKKLQENFWSPLGRKSKPILLCEIFLLVVCIGFHGNIYLILMSAAYNPRSPELLSSVFSHSNGEDTDSLESHHSVARWLCWGLHAYLMHVHVGNSLLMVLLSLPFIFSAGVILKEMSHRTCANSSPGFRKFANFKKNYQCMAILVQEFNNLHVVSIAGTKFVIILMAIFCTYGAIKFGGIVAIALGFFGLNCTIFLFVLFRLLASFDEKSSSILADWNSELGFRGRLSKADVSLSRKELRAVRRFRVCVGATYFVDVTMVLTMCRVIFESTINFLLMTV